MILIDIDECIDGTHGCSQICRNNIGSYSCLCNDGFQLNLDGFHCDGTIDYCIATVHNGTHEI